ncbi:MAG TPA: head-tail connector protein [Acidimicrobiales bacterium]|nr:head-tail connector protein [Acidimicrobiales bacterium]
MADWPTLKEVRSLLRLAPDGDDDALIDRARLAAIANLDHRCGGRYGPDGEVPDDMHQAALLQAARWYRRRDSLDGTVGWGDLGAIRVGRIDPDVEALAGAYFKVVFG